MRTRKTPVVRKDGGHGQVRKIRTSNAGTRGQCAALGMLLYKEIDNLSVRGRAHVLVAIGQLSRQLERERAEEIYADPGCVSETPDAPCASLPQDSSRDLAMSLRGCAERIADGLADGLAALDDHLLVDAVHAFSQVNMPWTAAPECFSEVETQLAQRRSQSHVLNLARLATDLQNSGYQSATLDERLISIAEDRMDDLSEDPRVLARLVRALTWCDPSGEGCRRILQLYASLLNNVPEGLFEAPLAFVHASMLVDPLQPAPYRGVGLRARFRHSLDRFLRINEHPEVGFHPDTNLFEYEVAQYIARVRELERAVITAQVPVSSGYQIDCMATLENGCRIAIECDGARYHYAGGIAREELRRPNDRLKQRLLEKEGIRVIRILDSTWRRQKNTTDKMYFLHHLVRSVLNGKQVACA